MKQLFSLACHTQPASVGERSICSSCGNPVQWNGWEAYLRASFDMSPKFGEELSPRVFINISTRPLQSMDVLLGTRAINGKIKCHYHVPFTPSLIRSISSIESSFPSNELLPLHISCIFTRRIQRCNRHTVVIPEHIASEHFVFPIPSYGSLVCPGIATGE